MEYLLYLHVKSIPHTHMYYIHVINVPIHSQIPKIMMHVKHHKKLF